MKVQDEMASQVISTKHTRNNLYKSFSNSSKRLKREKHSQSLSMNNHHPNAKPRKRYYQNRVTGQLLLFSCSVMSDSLWPHGLQHTRFPCPSPSPTFCSNSCPVNYDTIQPSCPLSSPSPPAFSLSQHQGCLGWIEMQKSSTKY